MSRRSCRNWASRAAPRRSSPARRSAPRFARPRPRQTPSEAWSRKVGTGSRKRSCVNKTIERDGDSKRSHRALRPALDQKVPVEEAPDLREDLLGFRKEREQELGVALAFEDLEHGFAAGLAELPV